MKRREVAEYDGYKLVPLEDTPENRRKAAEAMEEAVRFAEELRKKYRKDNKTI